MSAYKILRKLTPIKIAVTLALVLIAWLLLGEHMRLQDEPPDEQRKPQQSLAKVQVREFEAAPWSKDLIVQGQLEPWYQVAVTAQVPGRVVSIHKHQGEDVKADEILLEISDEGRTARLEQAEATVTLRQQELRSAETLEQSRLIAETELQRLRSDLADAIAQRAVDRLAVAYNRPKAPFDGLVDRRHVDPGEFVSAGTVLMDVIQIERLKVVAHIPQQDVAELQIGQEVAVELLDGRTLQGEISFISYAANSQTRAYYFEVATDNPERLRVAGASATLHIQLPPVMAHQISPALLSLNGKGQLGVHAVDTEDKVQFHAVDVLKVDGNNAIVQGLPERLRLITLGAGFVQPGQRVTAMAATEAPVDASADIQDPL